MSKVVVITGASAGIGAATAELLAQQQMSLGLMARRRDALAAVVARCGPAALAVVGDAAQQADVRRVVETALARFGHIDVWINNVGQGISRPPSQLTDEDIDEIMRLNVKTALYGMQEVLPHFKSRGEGHIINISSLLGRIPLAMIRSAYCGAKHFLNALTATFREEVQQTHPRYPGLAGVPTRRPNRFRAQRPTWRTGLPVAAQLPERPDGRGGHRRRDREPAT
jgi:NADP-dependent 3-hydroxy acid dehydrogenase YdfG